MNEALAALVDGEPERVSAEVWATKSPVADDGAW
jgi:hypothetical protein